MPISSSAHARAKTALDLLLGTQGWRRFAEQDAGKVQEKYLADLRTRTDADRLLVLAGQSSPETIDFLQRQRQKVEEKTVARRQEAAAELAKVTAADDAVLQQQKANSRLSEMRTEAATAQVKASAANARLDTFKSGGLLVLVVSLLVVLGLMLAMGLARSIPRWTLVPATVLGSLLLLVVVGVSSRDKSEPAGQIALNVEKRSEETRKRSKTMQCGTTCPNLPRTLLHWLLT